MYLTVLLQEYGALMKGGSTHPDVCIGLACAQFFLGMYKEANESTTNGMHALAYQREQSEMLRQLNDASQLKQVD